MNLLVIGSTGQLAQSLKERTAAARVLATLAGRPEIDLGLPESALEMALGGLMKQGSFDVVVNAAAYTAVDQAEADEANALAINATGAGLIAKAAALRGLPIIHVSTDYVFDGRKGSPYLETDSVSPLGAYGRTKLAGECAVASGNSAHVILRTAWVYSPFGKNFVKTMLRLAATSDVVSVVADQIGNPTSALDIADGILQVARVLKQAGSSAPFGTYHMTGTGEGSWADLAEATFHVSARNGGPSAKVRRITTDAFPTPATRPANSRLSCKALGRSFGVTLPDWRSSLEDCVQRLVSDQA